MHRKQPSLSIPLPSLDANLITNLIVVAGLVAVCVAVAFLTDWRWAVLLGGVLAAVVGVYVQRAAVEPAAKVTPLRRTG